MRRAVSRSLTAVVALTVWLPFGCYSTSLLQEPKPLAPGSARFALGAQWHAERQFSDASSHSGIPAPELGVRMGLTHGLEGRLKLALSSIEVGVNAQVLEARGLRVHLFPTVRAFEVKEDDDYYLDEHFVEDREGVAGSVPVILAIEATARVDLFIGPDLHAGSRDGEGFGAVGGHLGAAIDYGEHVTQIFECSMVVGVVGVDAAPSTLPHGEYEDDRQSWMTVGDFGGQCGTSFSFGSVHATP